MSLINIGNHDFEQVGSVRWQPNGWDLDRLIVPMQGSAENLAAFIAGLTMWDASDIDSNMFLSDWVSDGHPQFPTVDLIYLGCKDGAAKPVKYDKEVALQTVSYSQSIDDVGSYQIDVQYNAPVITGTQIVSVEDDYPSVSDPLDSREIVYWTAGALSTVNPGSVTQEILDDLIDYIFSDLVIERPRSEELVPGQYWRVSLTKTLLWTR